MVKIFKNLLQNQKAYDLETRDKLYKVYINDDPGLTLTYFKARSNWVAYNLNGENCYSHLMGENLQQVFMLQYLLCLNILQVVGFYYF